MTCQHATSTKKYPRGWHKPAVHHLTSLETQKCILKVRGPTWHTLASSRAIGAFNYKEKKKKVEKGILINKYGTFYTTIILKKFS